MNLSEIAPRIYAIMILKEIIGYSATFFTIGVFLSGIQICVKIIKRKSTGDISPMPFLFGFVNCSFWMRYGMYVKDNVLMNVNAFGVTLQIFYIICYGKYIPAQNPFVQAKTRVNKTGCFAVIRKFFVDSPQGAYAMHVVVALLVVVSMYSSLTFFDKDKATFIAGITSSTASVLYIASPLASMAHVLRTKSVECLPFYMIICSFIMATLWVWYGVLIHDLFVQVPNFLGAVASGCQLGLFLIYPSKPPMKYKELLVKFPRPDSRNASPQKFLLNSRLGFEDEAIHAKT